MNLFTKKQKTEPSINKIISNLFDKGINTNILFEFSHKYISEKINRKFIGFDNMKTVLCYIEECLILEIKNKVFEKKRILIFCNQLHKESGNNLIFIAPQTFIENQIQQISETDFRKIISTVLEMDNKLEKELNSDLDNLLKNKEEIYKFLKIQKERNVLNLKLIS